MKSLLGVCVFAVALVAQPQPASAVVSTVFGIDYGAGSTSPRPESNAAAASFDAGQTNIARIDFESLAVGSYSALSIAPGVSVSGSQVFSVANFPVNSDNRRSGYNTTAGGANFLQLYGGTVTFTFSQPIVAFGAFITGMTANGASFEFNDGASQSVVTSSLFFAGIFGGAAFVGFRTDALPFTSVTFRTTTELGVGDQISLDDLRFVGAVPEQSTTAMLSAGLLVIVAGSIRTRRRSAALR